MALKDLFRGGKPKPRTAAKTERYSVSDLVALGRLDEARETLEKRLKANPREHHTRLKLADLLMKQGKGADAMDVYLQVADGYSADGFFDKAHALLARLSRMLPGEAKLAAKLERLERAQELERRREVVTRAVVDAGRVKMSAFTLQTLWSDIAKCSLVEELSEPQVARLFSLVDLEKVAEDDRLVSAGADRHEMFIIIQGEIVAQVLLASGKRTDLRTFTSGDIVGENALLKRRAWPASYLARRRTTMFRLDRAGLENLLLGEADPRGLLDALRAQGHDDDVGQTLSQLSQTGPDE